MAKRIDLSSREINTMVADATGEHIRDIDYVLSIYHDIIRQALVQGKKISITHLFSIEVVNCKGKVGKNNQGIWVQRKPFKKLKCKPSYKLRNDWGEDIATKLSGNPKELEETKESEE